MTPPARAERWHMGNCPDCGKRRYTHRKTAKEAAKSIAPGDTRTNVYRCGDYWHWGHLPAAIKNGTADRTIYNR